MNAKRSRSKNPPSVSPSVNVAARPQTASSVLWMVGGLCILVTLLVYIPAFYNGFVNSDENLYIIKNPHLQKPLGEAIGYFFGLNYFVGNYHPLTMIGYAIIYHAAGLSPAAYHAVNIFLHLINVGLVWYFTFLLSGRRWEIAGIVAIFFGIHPMHVESVAWVGELKDVLYTAFFMGGLIAYYYYVRQDDRKENFSYTKLGYALLLFVLSGLSKPAAVTFPLTLLLIDYYTRRSFTLRLWMEKIPFFALALVFGILNIMAQKEAIVQPAIVTFDQRILFACYSFMQYIIKLFLPLNLSSFYPMPAKGAMPVAYFIAPVVVLLTAFGVVLLRKRSRLFVFGVLFFFANIFLVLQFMPFGRAIIAERYTYVPYIGLFYIMAVYATRALDKHVASNAALKWLIPALITLVTGMWSYQSYQRCKVWNNSETLWLNVIETFPESDYAYYGLGLHYNEQRDYRRGAEAFEKSLARTRAADPELYNVLGVSYGQIGKPDLAIRYLELAKSGHKDPANVYNNLGYVLVGIRDYDRAISEYSTALAIDSRSFDACFNLAICYYYKNDYPNAIGYYQKARSIDSISKPVIYKELGFLYSRTGENLKAKQYLDSALVHFPDSSNVYSNMGYVMLQLNKPFEASVFLQKAVDLDPRNQGAYKSLGAYYLQEKDFATALKYFDKARDLDSTDYQNYLNYALVYHTMGNDVRAKQYFAEAYRLSGGNINQ